VKGHFARRLERRGLKRPSGSGSGAGGSSIERIVGTVVAVEGSWASTVFGSETNSVSVIDLHNGHVLRKAATGPPEPQDNHGYGDWGAGPVTSLVLRATNGGGRSAPFSRPRGGPRKDPANRGFSSGKSEGARKGALSLKKAGRDFPASPERTPYPCRLPNVAVADPYDTFASWLAACYPRRRQRRV
jgi:hypothetical protein